MQRKMQMPLLLKLKRSATPTCDAWSPYTGDTVTAYHR